MAVYDDQNPENEEDNALRERLGDLYNHDPKTMDRHSAEDEGGADDEDTTKRRGLRERDEAADEADTEDVKGQVRAGFLKAQEQDAADRDGEGGGFFRATKGKIKAAANPKGKSSSNRNKIIVGASIGAVTIGVGLIATLGNFFAVFKLDHILQNIDVKSFSRFNASFSDRSDAYFKAYLKMRMAEISNPDGSYNDTMLFKGDRVDTDRPIRDWYRTLRTGSFEKDLQKNTGISFVGGSIRNENGTTDLRPMRINFNNAEIAKLDPETSGLKSQTIANLKAGKLTNADLTDLNKIGDKAESIMKTEVFPDSKTARKAIKEDLKKNAHFFNVIKRRHIRKDIQNKTGITSWKFFETTRDKVTNKKIQVQQKILRKVLPNSKAGNFIGCILGSGKCNYNRDPSAPESQLGATPTGNVPAENQPESTPDLDNTTTDPKTGDVSAPQLNDTPGVAGEIADAADKTVTGELTDATIKEANDKGLTLIEKEAVDGASSGTNPITTATRIWSWLQKITKISNNIENNVFGKLVTNTRLAQLSAAYATYSIMRDQGKSGQLTADEFGEAMTTLDDVGQSEGWINSSSPASGNAVSAEAATAQTNANKADFCKMNVKEQKLNKIHYFCASPNGNNAEQLSEDYKNSVVCDLICPIAKVVNGIKDNPVTNFFSGVLNFIGDAAGDILSALNIDDLFKAILDKTGISGSFGKLIKYGMAKLMAFLGAGPISDFTPDSGITNFLIAGSAATAEASTRDSGGVASTPTTLSYANNLAANYEKGLSSQQSLFDRYASLSNTKSLFSTALFSVANFNISTDISHALSSFGIIPKTVGSLFGGNAFAAVNDFDTASWAGVNTYDIPPACQTLDPLGSDYLVNAVGVVADSPWAGKAQSVVDAIRSKLTNTNERDSAQFWKLVYDEIGNDTAQEEIAGAIYNCALFDQRVMSGLGYTSGYGDDHGLNDGSTANTTAPATPPSTIPSANGLNGYAIPCTGQPAAVKRLAGPRADWTGVPDSGTIGTNSEGQPIKTYVRAACDTANFKTIIIVGGIHGNENGGGLVAWDLLFNAKLPNNVRIVAVPELNGWGINNNRRVNKNGVDLNRNEDYNWGQGDPDNECSESSATCNHYQGPSVASEPETKVIDAFLLSLGKVDLFTVYHSALDWVAPVGDTPIIIGNKYAASASMTGKGSGRVGVTSTVTQHGSLDAWYNKQTSTPSLLIELGTDKSPTIIDRHVNAIQQLLISGTI